MNQSQPLLMVRGLRKSFQLLGGVLGGPGRIVRALDGVSFDIKHGTTLGVVGESGCGKTTLGRVILRLTAATGGKVFFDGVDVLAASRAGMRRLRRDMQIIFQDPASSLDPRMTVGTSIAEPLAVHGVARKGLRSKMVADLLTRVGLPPEYAGQFPHEFSGGQRQRIGIARAIALQPKLIVCDEPVSALDVSVQSQVLNLLRELQDELGLTYLFIAHNLAVVRHLSDRVAVMYLGRIVEIADVADLYDQPCHPYTRALLAAVPDPDPRVRANRVALEGETPHRIEPPSGCPFHPRCSVATNRCRESAPRLLPQRDLPPAHHVACHLATEGPTLSGA